MSDRTLIVGFGNPGRRDDGLGPNLAEEVDKWGLPGVTVAVDYQLNIEHAAEVAAAELVVFIDASLTAAAPFSFHRLEPGRKNEFTTHAMLPETVLETCRQVYGSLPPAYLLAVRGEEFEMGESLSGLAGENFLLARRLLEKILSSPDRQAACRQSAGEDGAESEKNNK